jgi:hypothetical protein
MPRRQFSFSARATARSLSAKAIALASIFFISASLSFGQTGLASVTGTITDTAGAAIPNAPVTLKNLDNGSVYTGASSATGNYNISQLPIGDYDLTVSFSGFKTYTHSKFHLSANQTALEDVRLEIGTTGESIVVTAEASMLRTESSEVSHNVTLTQMNNLPLLQIGVSNQGFRDPFSAVRLVPGVRYAQGGASNTMVINGTPANSVQIRLDGATQGALGQANALAGAVGQHQPSVDAIEEVAIQTSNFAAEFGTAGGAVINMVSKSGTNQYHGTVYDYMRNEALDAHQNYTGLRNKVRQHDWGFTFGGPVRIPKLYNGTNKTFFFWNYEQYRNKQTITTGSTTVPIPAYRNGDFSNLTTQENRLLSTASGPYTDPLQRTIPSGTIFDPLDTVTVPATGQVLRNPFPGNRIPVARFDPTSVKILALVPQPFGVNATRGQVGSNYQAPYDLSRVSQIPSIKIDQNIGTKNKVSFYLSETKTRAPRSPTGADNFPDSITASVSSFSAATSSRINWDYTATSRLLLHFGVAWNDIDFILTSPNNNYDAFKELGLRQTIKQLFPQIITGNSGAALGGMGTLGTGSGSAQYERRPAGNISGTYVAGRHTFKAGVEYRLEKYPSYSIANTAGTYTFGTNYTTQTSLQGTVTNAGFAGFNFASFMLGGMSGLTMAAPTAASTSKSQSSLYLQDNWKATRKLTLDLGVRWDYGTYAREMYGRFSSFSPSIPNPSAAGRLGARAFESVCKCNFASNYPYAIGPRVGFAYQIDRKTVIRGGIGIVYNSTSQAAGGAVNTGFTGTPGFGQILGQLRDGTPANVNPVWPNFDPAAGQGAGAVITMPFGVDPNAGRPARQVQWNFTVQREINRNLVVEAAYVANRGTWWEASGLVLLNQLSQDVLNLSTVSANATQGPILRARGIVSPYSNFPGGSQTVRQSLLPFPQFTGQNPSGAPLGNTWYDSLQLTLNKRFSHGLQFNINYNYSKSLDLMSSPDPFNRQLGKNLGGFDLPHQFRFTAQYTVPDPRKTGMPVLSNKWLAQSVMGWGLGLYLNYQSAGLVGRPASPNTTPISQFLGRGPGSAQLKKNADGSFMNPWSVDWVDYSGKRHTDPIDVNCHCFDVTKNVVLNPLAWEAIPNGQWATNMSSIRNFRGIRFPAENANLSRNFRFGKENRFNLNVRVEFTNIFNRLQYPGISLGANFQDAARVFQPVANATVQASNVGLYSAGFGVINPTGGTGGQRLGTFVGRLTF